MPAPPVRVVLSRGTLPESEHRVAVAVWRDGRIDRAAGDTGQRVYLRSSAKPLQALAAVVSGAADRFAMTDAELALACGSHNGEPVHAETAAGLLARIGLDVSALQCGAHPPMHDPAARALLAAGLEPTALHNNCSGKHAAMLASCVAAGWTTADYLDPAHPLQVLNRTHVGAFCGVPADDVVLATDGCSAPVFAVPLAAAARGFAAVADSRIATDATREARAAAVRITDALAARPEMIGGTKRLDTDLIRATGGRVLSKMGAEGVWCCGVRGAKLGLAIKCEDGSGRAPPHVGLAVLRSLGVLSDAEWAAIAPHHDPALRNHRRLVVGRVEVVPPTGV